MQRPDYLSEGDRARLLPVLATTSKEGRTTSIVLSCLTLIDEFGAELLGTLGVNVGKRTKIDCYTEVCFKGARIKSADRPDGLIVASNGNKEWRALVETKVGKNSLTAEQIERYRTLAREHSIDCVLTISNQFAAAPQLHPLTPELNRRLRLPVYHWSWTLIQTVASLMLARQEVKDLDQARLLYELVRFLEQRWRDKSEQVS